MHALPADTHAPILGSRLLHWDDEAACAAHATALAAHPGIADAYIELHGPLGAGKTTFVRHLLRALGVTGRIKSPTYTVVEPYELAGRVISHFDFYRFTDPREWADAGLRELFAGPGLKLAEWPEHAAGALPVADLRLYIEPQPDDSRRVRAEAGTARGMELL
jgi:tRNA threonylcarbamoyladenosine biosynthesis protein TsaE